MSGFLGTRADPIFDFTLLLEIAALIILIIGYRFKLQKKLRSHGMMMSIAVVLHTIAILAAMVPSLARYSFLMTEISDPLVLITWVHVPIGTITDILGIFLVSEWRFRRPPKMTCVMRRSLMKPVLVLWVLATVLGTSFYAYAYIL